MDDSGAILNLLYRYAALVDAGDFDGIGEIFAHAVLLADGAALELRGADAIATHYLKTTRRYPDTGTPKTKHQVTNVIVEVDEAAGTGRCEADYTVLQATEKISLQAIITGRYNSTFERVDGEWRFASHKFFVDQIGDLSQHLLFELGEAQG